MKVISRSSSNVYKILRNDKEVNVSTERLKPAYMERLSSEVATTRESSINEPRMTQEIDPSVLHQDKPSQADPSIIRAPEVQGKPTSVPARQRQKITPEIKPRVISEHKYASSTKKQIKIVPKPVEPPAVKTCTFIQPHYVPRILKTYYGRKCVRFKCNDKITTI